MSTEHPWEEVDVLIPKRILDGYERGLEDIRQQVTELIGAIPDVEFIVLPASESADLAEADPDACRAWVSRIIRALPTTADLESIRGNF